MAFEISIIVPVYNLEGYISATLNSIINQSDREFELIVIDDGSTDNSYNIARDLLEGSKLSDYKIIKKENGGVSSARNLGLDSAKGEYVIFIDGDDIITSDLVMSVRDSLSKKYDLVFWGFDYIDEDKTVIKDYFSQYSISNGEIISGEKILEANLINKIKICTGSIAIKKKILINNNINYYDGCVNGEDQEFTQKLLCKTDTCVGIRKSLTKYVLRQGSITQSHNIRRFDSIYALGRMFEYLEKNSSAKIQLIVNDLKGERIVNNYLGNVNNSIRYLYKNKNLNNNGVNVLFNEIAVEYPDIEYDINKILKYDTRLKLSTKLQLNILTISKMLYGQILKMYDYLMK